MKTTLKLTLVCFCFFSLITSYAQKETVYTGSTTYGGEGGQSFTMPEEILSSRNFQARQIKKISLKTSHRIEKIQLTWAAAKNGQMSASAGENGGTWKHIILSKNEYITRVTGKAGRFVSQLTFYTNTGKKYGPYGGQEGEPFTINVPRGYQVLGFFGKAGQCIDKFGLVYQYETIDGKVVTPNRPRPGTATPRPASDRVTDHRKSGKGKTRPNVVDHRKKQEEAREKWMKENGLDPNKAGG